MITTFSYTRNGDGQSFVQAALIRRDIRARAFWFLIVLAGTLSMQQLGWGQAPAGPSTDPLLSWNDGPSKQAILDFVRRVTTANSPDYVPIEDRIATFDNDGTLWPEKPFIEGEFVFSRLREEAKKNPSLALKQPYKAVLDGDMEYFARGGDAALGSAFFAAETGMTEDVFDAEVRAFITQMPTEASYSRYHLPYYRLGYEPMIELLSYLRANGFETWICSGGTADFMRVFSQDAYGIPPQQVIGTVFARKFIDANGTASIVRQPQLVLLNDQAQKPVGISMFLGHRPIFAAGNVESAGDVEMMEYTQSNHHLSFELIIHHDDAKREFAYEEKDHATLNAAQTHHWHVVSMAKDWKRIFADRP